MPITPIPAEAEIVKTPSRILQLLERARSCGYELHAAVPGSDEIWRTSISRIDADASQIIYGQLTPTTWRTANLAQPAEIHCLVPGCRLAYSAVLMPTEETGICYFESELPSSLHYLQLRRMFRVSVVSERAGVAVGIGESRFEGTLLDLSEGGCRARLPGPCAELATGIVLEDCRIWLEDSLDLCCRVEVRHVRAAGEAQEVGMAFVSLPPQDQQQLQRCIAELQRANLRRGLARFA